jgi:hypothetical protein
MVVPFAFLENVILVEIALVIFIIILAYVLKYYFYLKTKKEKRIIDSMEQSIVSAVASQTPLSESAFPKSWRRLDLILPLFFKLDSTINSSYWLEMKATMVRTILLPIARKKFNSRLWMNRLHSAQCFELGMEDQDEIIVSTLLEDKIPLVHLHAAIAAIKFSSVTLINLIINAMAKKRRLSQTVYLKVFDMAAPHSKQFISDRMNTENDPFIRSTCYKILSNYKDTATPMDTSADIHSNNMELRLAAIRYTAYADKSNAVPLLVSLLSDPHWEVRAASNRLLGELNATQAIDEISNCLKDQVWWVRVNAATTLKNFGEIGIKVLNEQDPKSDLYAYETAMHVLNKSLT